MPVCEPFRDGYVLRVKLAPGASFCGFKGVYASADGLQYLKAYVTAVPEKGRANEMLIKLLAKKLKLPKNAVEIISGATDHCKKIFIAAGGDNIEALINALAGEEKQ